MSVSRMLLSLFFLLKGAMAGKEGEGRTIWSRKLQDIGTPTAAEGPMTSIPGQLVSHLTTDCGQDQVLPSDSGPNGFKIELVQTDIGAVSGCNHGARVHTLEQYPTGYFSAKIKPPGQKSSGLDLSFYLSSHEEIQNANGQGVQDEIDFEFMGKDTSSVQLNYFVNGTGGHEHIVNLGFDASLDFHWYTIHWTPEAITWYVDIQQVHQVVNVPGQPFPSKQMYVYCSFWDAAMVSVGWAGPIDWSAAPWYGEYNSITVQSP